MFRLERLTLADLPKEPPRVAVLPLGAIEPHSYHLPYGNDYLTVCRIAELACGRAYERGTAVVLLPGIPYGVDKNLLHFPLTIHVSLFTLHRLIGDIIGSLERHGVRSLVLLNGHGGNTLKPLLREWYGDTSLFISVVDWWKVGQDKYGEIFEEPDDHAGEMETSVALALYPELVHMERAAYEPPQQSDIEAIRAGWAQMTRPWHVVAPTSGTADPRKATAEKGRRYVELSVERIATYLQQLADAQITEGFPRRRESPGRETPR